jgi:hypothetical protein
MALEQKDVTYDARRSASYNPYCHELSLRGKDGSGYVP